MYKLQDWCNMKCIQYLVKRNPNYTPCGSSIGKVPEMSIKIDIPSVLQPFTSNLEVVEVNGSTVGGCLNHLVKKFPSIEKILFAKNDKLFDYVVIFVNGEAAYSGNLARPVHDGDKLNILYIIDMIAGG